jgi:hypothetical protein
MIEYTNTNSNSNNKKEKNIKTSKQQEINNQIKSDMNLATKLAETDKPSRNTRYANRTISYEATSNQNSKNVKSNNNNFLGEKRANSNIENSLSEYSEDKLNSKRTQVNEASNSLKEKSEDLNTTSFTNTETLKFVLINVSSKPIANVFSSSIVKINLYILFI